MYWYFALGNQYVVSIYIGKDEITWKYNSIYILCNIQKHDDAILSSQQEIMFRHDYRSYHEKHNETTIFVTNRNMTLM